MALKYESNPKHKHPWQPGRKGSLCPKQIDLKRASKLLDGSVLHDDGHRYAVDAGVAFKGQIGSNGKWHGYPVGWVEVPETVRPRFLDEKRVRRRDISRNW